MKPTSTSDGALRGRIHPQFEGPIGAPRKGRRARYSFIGADGKRQFHTTALAGHNGENKFSEQERKSLLGEK